MAVHSTHGQRQVDLVIEGWRSSAATEETAREGVASGGMFSGVGLARRASQRVCAAAQASSAGIYAEPGDLEVVVGGKLG